MKITICDDSIKDLLTIEKLLSKYKTLYPDKDFEIEKFSDPSRLSHKILEGKLTDIYILDMLMPVQTGIDLGRQIRMTSSRKCDYLHHRLRRSRTGRIWRARGKISFKTHQ